ncbi:hypothetical protein, partial [Clostridium tyrobutyricum]|uniref:hypothetical protein n=1 Tax=Clostridium tyrobutyricum TaxID=1519 RepID=UPI0005800BA6
PPRIIKLINHSFLIFIYKAEIEILPSPEALSKYVIIIEILFSHDSVVIFFLLEILFSFLRLIPLALCDFTNELDAGYLK